MQHHGSLQNAKPAQTCNQAICKENYHVSGART